MTNLIQLQQPHSLFQPHHLIVVAISGGLDSVVLAHMLKMQDQPMLLAHVNFQLRGEESDRDEQFVKDLAKKWQVTLAVNHYDTAGYAALHKKSIQVAARELRYSYFDTIRKVHQYFGEQVLIATAHHANDSVETMLMHLMRGTGIEGLKGIPAKNGYIIRPLLPFTRNQLEAYAKHHNLSWVEDSSNQKDSYTRNYIRHHVIPAMEQALPQAVAGMVATQQKIADATILYKERVEQRLKKLIVFENDIQKVAIKGLEKANGCNALIWEWIKPFGFTDGQVAEVVKLFTSETGKYIQSASHRIMANRAWLLLLPVANASHVLQKVETLPAKLMLGEAGWLNLSILEGKPKEGFEKLPPNEALLDAKAITLPLIVRPWKQGDYFYPLGMQKKKKVARFLIDQKLSMVQKENVWVVESNKRIVWVVGYRIDERFKITENTFQTLTLKYTKT